MPTQGRAAVTESGWIITGLLGEIFDDRWMLRWDGIRARVGRHFLAAVPEAERRKSNGAVRPGRPTTKLRSKLGNLRQTFMAFFRFSSILSRNPVVDSHFWSGPTRIARSLVMSPASTVATVTFSKVS